jgi:hypothetical protein
MTQLTAAQNDLTWADISRRYVELAGETGGTPTDLMLTLRGYVRQWARAMLRGDPTLGQKELAQQFGELADRIYQQARQEEWSNAHSLNLGSVVRKSVMEVKV